MKWEMFSQVNFLHFHIQGSYVKIFYFPGNNLNPFDLEAAGWVVAQLFIYDLGKSSVDMILSNPKVVQLLNSDQKFDLVLYEIFGMEAFAGLGQHFGCPVIGYTTFGVTTWANYMTGNPNGHSFIPNPFLSHTANMNFYQRFKNKLTSIVESFFVEFTYLPAQRKLYKKFFPNSKSSFDEDIRNVSLILLNDHFSQSSVKHYLPNMIEISGNHVQEPKPLPEVIKNYFFSSKNLI